MATRLIDTPFGVCEVYEYNQYERFHIGIAFKVPVVLARHWNGTPSILMDTGSMYRQSATLRNRVFNEPSAATIIFLLQRMVEEQINENRKSNLR